MPRVTVDFTDVQGGFDVVPEGLYVGVIEEITRKTSQNSGEPMLEWHYKIVEGKFKGSILYEFTSLQKQALFRLKQRLDALGYEIPAGPLTFDTDDLVGMPIKIQCGQPRKLPAREEGQEPRFVSNVVAVVGGDSEAAEPETEEEAPPEPVVKKRPKTKAAAEEEDEFVKHEREYDARRPAVASSAPTAKPKRLNLSRL